jgi:hypothetical protein
LAVTAEGDFIAAADAEDGGGSCGFHCNLEDRHEV